MKECEIFAIWACLQIDRMKREKRIQNNSLKEILLLHMLSFPFSTTTKNFRKTADHCFIKVKGKCLIALFSGSQGFVTRNGKLLDQETTCFILLSRCLSGSWNVALKLPFELTHGQRPRISTRICWSQRDQKRVTQHLKLQRLYYENRFKIPFFPACSLEIY